MSAFSTVELLGYGISYLWQNESSRNTQKELQDIRKEANMSVQYAMQYDENGLSVAGIAALFWIRIPHREPVRKSVIIKMGQHHQPI